MDEVVTWLTNRSYYTGQLQDDRTRPGRTATIADVAVSDRTTDMLADEGIEDLYSHQVAAIEAVRSGDDVVLATPTASGKTIAYTVPAFERALDHGGRTLYIGPQNALVADQATKLDRMEANLGFGSKVTVDTYTGRLSDSDRAAVRDRKPTVLLTNPDMLHYGILPHAHRLWDWFFRGLETIVVDEIHTYRGVFGSHVGLVLRRLNRVCERFDSSPEYVCCSATIGNPRQHTAKVTNRAPDALTVLTESGASTGPKRWLAWNPPVQDADQAVSHGRRRSSHTESNRLFCDLIQRGFQTLVFTRSRQTAERYAATAADELRDKEEPSLADAVTAYQAGLTGERRREIETGLQTGDIRGVWSTNALELGVDIGALDVVILDGYPGTRMETFQRAGRAGRGEDPALVILVAGDDQLDQYILNNPDTLFEGPPEDAVSNPANEAILPNHILCAARENWLRPEDEAQFGPQFRPIVRQQTSAGTLEQRGTDDGPRWTPTEAGYRHQTTNLRSIDETQILLRTNQDHTNIGTLPLSDALRDVHPGAIYHHQGRTYEVVDLDLDAGIAELTPTWADYYTRVLTDKTIEIDANKAERVPFDRDDIPVRLADITLTEQVVEYQRHDDSTGQSLGSITLDLPEQTLETTALYWTLPTDIEATLVGEQHLPGAIHAAEHAAISLLPLRVLCDRGDIGGLSTPHHPATEKPTVFIYDGYPGGVGLTKSAFQTVRALLEDTETMLRDCPCEDGCPSCVQSPQCGNANDPLSKRGAITLLSHLRAEPTSNTGD